MKNKIDYLKLFLYKLVLISLVFASFVFLRIKLKNYLAFYSQYAILIDSLQNAVLDNTQNIAQLSSLVETLNTMTNNYLLLAFLVVPLAIFIFYCVFEGLIWKDITGFKDKKKFFRNFTLLSLAGFLVIYLIFYLLWDYVDITDFNFDKKLILFPVVFFLILYWLTISYAVIEKGLIKTAKKAFNIFVKKFHKLFIPALIYFFIIFGIIINMFSIMVYYISDTKSLLIYVYFVFLVVLTAVSLPYKVYLKNFIQKV